MRDRWGLRESKSSTRCVVRDDGCGAMRDSDGSTAQATLARTCGSAHSLPFSGMALAPPSFRRTRRQPLHKGVGALNQKLLRVVRQQVPIVLHEAARRVTHVLRAVPDDERRRPALPYRRTAEVVVALAEACLGVTSGRREV